MNKYFSFLCPRGNGAANLCRAVGLAAVLLFSCGGREKVGETRSQRAETTTAAPPPEGAASFDNGASSTGDGAPPPDGFWEELCNRQLGRVDRCGETVGFDSLEDCLADKYDRACSELIDAPSAALIIDHLKKAPCRPGTRVMADEMEILIDKRAIVGAEKTAQDACVAMMQNCAPEDERRCIAPMLKQPYRARVFECYTHGCAGIRRCTETVLEQGGCP